MVPYSAKRICSDTNKCEIKAPTKYIVKISVACIIVPLFDRNDDSVTLELEKGGKNSKQLTCQLKKGDAYIVCCKNHVNNSKKCRHNSVDCALHCRRHTLIAKSSLQLQGFQVLVILHILPSNEELQPPQEKQEEHDEETDSRLVSYNGKLFKLVNNVGDGLCLFYSVSLFFTELHSQEKSTFSGEWLPYIIMTNSKTFSDSNVIQDLAKFLCTICEMDFDALVECYGDIEKKDKVLPLEYALFVERANLKTEESQNKGIVKLMNDFIFNMINATKTKDGSWPGEAHALVLSKMLRVRIVIVQNNYNGLMGLFDSDSWIFEGIPGLSETILRKAPNGQKTCNLLQTNSKIPPFMCDWENNFNHFVNLQEILEGFYILY